MSSEDKAWLDYQKDFANNYDDLNYTAGLQNLVMKAGHKCCEKNLLINIILVKC